MRLYHYTSAAMADAILLSDLSNGHMRTPEGVIGPVVWLTSDPKAEGHGLLNGTETLTDRNMDHLEKLQGKRPQNRTTSDKMKVRLTFDIPENEMHQLQRFIDYWDCRPGGKRFAKWTGVSCYIDTATANHKRVQAMMKSHPTKEKTWWISFLPVSARFITAVELRGADGAYHPYDFEKLVRPALGELGFFAPSAKALQELQTSVKPKHPLGYIKALVICFNSDATPIVGIRDGGSDLLYEIETGKSLTDTMAYEPQLSDWVATHRTDLMEAWAQAKESYYSFYPERRAA
jgi:hypothetical protein